MKGRRRKCVQLLHIRHLRGVGRGARSRGVHCMKAEKEQKEMYFNHTTPHVTPLNPKWGFAGYYALISFVLLILIGCAVAVVVYIRRKARLDELRHRLIPLYSYDPAEEEAWSDAGRDDEEEELTEPLYKEGKLSFSSGCRT